MKREAGDEEETYVKGEAEVRRSKSRIRRNRKTAEIRRKGSIGKRIAGV